MPYGQDPTAPPGGYGKDPTTKPGAKPPADQPQADTSSLSSFWNYLKGSAASLAQAGRQFGGDILAGASEFGESLLPTRGGAEAGGRLPGELLGKIGDVGTFITGGLQNPLGAAPGGRIPRWMGGPQMPAGAGGANVRGVPGAPTPSIANVGELARGLDVQPRVAQPPRLALPSPSIAGDRPAGPWDRAPDAPAQAPQRLLPAPGNLATAEPGYPPPQQGPRLALPPPTSQVPGRPPIETGPGRPTEQVGPFRYTPPPGTGQIPAGPGSTARPTFPQSSAAFDPLGPTPMPRPRGGPAPAPGEPPFDPVARPGRAAPAAPLAGPDAALGQPSELASSLVSGDTAAVDRKLVKRYGKLVGPRGLGEPSYPGITTQEQRITTAVDSLIEATVGRPEAGGMSRQSGPLRLTDAKGKQLPPGTMPRTLRQFSQGIDYLKSQIFDAYDTLARQTTGQGVRVSLQPVVDHLRQLAAEPQIRDLYEGRLAAAAERQAELWQRAGSYTPKEMQNVIQHLNAQLEGVMKEKETFSYNTMMNQAVVTMRQNLNDTMMNALQGPQYQALRNRYGALADIEGDVANALKRQMAKDPLIQQLLQRSVGNISLWVGALHGAGSAALHGFDPKGIAIGTSIKAGEMLHRYLNAPNPSVSRLFAKRAQALDPTVSQRLSAEMATKIGDIRQQAYDANVAGNIPEVQRLARQRAKLMQQ